MDSDDIAVEDRFEKQLQCFLQDKELALVGGNISEFIDNPENIVAKRTVPSEDSDIKKYMKSRCPFNHMTVMFRKQEVLKAGNYIHWFWNEDYYLWIRMALKGSKFANLKDVLVNVRVGKDMYARRGGWKYFKSEAGIQKYMLNQGMISYIRYLYNVCGRFVIQILLPNNLRGVIFQKVFRK